jgi:hypothetical protein
MTVTQLDSESETSQRGTSVVVGADGNPVVFGHRSSEQDLRISTCSNATCTSSATSTVDSTGNSKGYSAALIGADNNPVIAYFDSGSPPAIKVAACSDSTCTSATVTQLGSVNPSGTWVSIVLGADNNPVIAYANAHSDVAKVMVVACSNATCTSSTVTEVWEGEGFETTEPHGGWVSIALGANDNPLITFYAGGESGGLHVIGCGNATCTSVTRDRNLIASGRYGRQTSVAIGAGALPEGYNDRPIVSYENSSDSALYVGVCDSTCMLFTPDTALGAVVRQDPVNPPGFRGTQIAIGTDDKPVVVFTDSGGNVSIAECDAWDCSTGATISTITDSGRGGSVSLAIRDSDNARIITYIDDAPGQLQLKIAVLSAP